jgi:hypothetical protein
MEGHEYARAKVFDHIFPLVLLQLNHVHKISLDLAEIKDLWAEVSPEIFLPAQYLEFVGVKH